MAGPGHVTANFFVKVERGNGGIRSGMKTNITISTDFAHRLYCVVKTFRPIFDAITT
jgi:hypothetical protein